MGSLLLNKEEFESLKTQFATSKRDGIRYAPIMAFTEQGVAMLSSVLNSEKAIKVNIEIMRAFVMLKKIPVGFNIKPPIITRNSCQLPRKQKEDSMTS